MSKKKDKSQVKDNNTYLYNVVFEDGSYLVINTDAKDEKEIFKSTLKLEDSTFYNSKLIGDVESLIDEYSGYLYVANNVFVREFKQVAKIEKYELNKVSLASDTNTNIEGV